MSDTRKRYVVTRDGGGNVHALVETRTTGDGGEEWDSYPLPHSKPSGLWWSGPADLARSIVGDLTSDEAPHPADYQTVKALLVATLEGDGPHAITEEAVRRVMGGRGA